MDGMVFLEKDVRMIMLKFNFSNPNVIPPWVRRLDQKTQEEQSFRKSRSDGVLVIEPTERCSLVNFLREIQVSQYEIVDAFYKQGIDTRKARIKRKNHTVCFFFARREFVELSDEFKKERPFINEELWKICKTAIWRVRLFFNPFYKDGEVIDGQYALSVNLDTRQPLFYPNGQPVTEWQRNDNNERIGEVPFPLKAKYDLRIKNYPHMENSAISLMVS